MFVKNESKKERIKASSEQFGAEVTRSRGIGGPVWGWSVLLPLLLYKTYLSRYCTSNIPADTLFLLGIISVLNYALQSFTMLPNSPLESSDLVTMGR